MPKKPTGGLSKFDIFGLGSGIFGLVVNLGTFLGWLGFSKANLNISWVTSVIFIFYTAIIAGFYSRRILFAHNISEAEKHGQSLHWTDLPRIEHAATIITCVICSTLCLAFIYNFATTRAQSYEADLSAKRTEVNNRYDRLVALASGETPNSASKIERIEDNRQTELKDIVRKKVTDGPEFVMSIFGIIVVSVGLVALSNYLSKAVYKGVDSSYKA